MGKLKIRLIKILLVFFLSIFISCNKNKNPIITNEVDKYITASITEDYSYISNPEERWNKYDLHNYTIIQKFSCFCPQRGPYKIFVVNDQINDVLDINADTLLSKEKINNNHLLTIDELFKLVKSIAPDSVSYLSIEYEERFGYPSTIFVDPNSQIADEEYGYKTYSLERIIKIR